jgi:hypothetical protein
MTQNFTDAEELLRGMDSYTMSDEEREEQRQSYARSCAVRGPRQAVMVVRGELDPPLGSAARSAVNGLLDAIQNENQELFDHHLAEARLHFGRTNDTQTVELRPDYPACLNCGRERD